MSTKMPGFEDVMLPILRAISDGKEYVYAEVEDRICKDLNIGEEERRVMAGKKRAIYDRITWAKHYLKRHGLIGDKYAKLQISEEGKKVLANPPERITAKYLNDKYPPEIEDEPAVDEPSPETPRELIERGLNRAKQALISELRKKLSDDVNPNYFEKIVGDVFRAQNYGAVNVVGGSNDGGIDIEIKRDEFGLDMVYCQVKRYSGDKVGSEEIRGFGGALLHTKSKSGIFVTLSDFTEGARGAAREMKDYTIKLINGTDLIELMIKYDVGVRGEDPFQIKKIDNEYFVEQLESR